MPESFNEYRARVSGLLGSRDPMRVLAATPRRLTLLTKRSARAALVRRPVPEGIHPDSDVDRQEARAFVDAHYSSKWLAPHPVGETWVGLRDDAGILRATGLAAVTPAGVVRLSGITVPAAERGRGLGRAVTQGLVEHGLTVADEVTLGVDDDNHAARATYSRMGFRVSHDFSSGLLVPGKGRSQ